jgi:hypothetical protein
MSEEIKNRVTESGLITLDLEQFFPEKDILSFDIRPFLFMDQILRERDFRDRLAVHDWSAYRGKHVAVHCSVEAIIPAWAYMTIAVHLSEYAASIYQGNPSEMLKSLIIASIRSIDTASFHQKRVLVKGCGEKGIDAYAYLEVTTLLMPVVKSIMYGEACSAVPVYKRRLTEGSSV